MEYDVVETSDLEELEELRAPLPSAKSNLDIYLRNDEYSPRKRIKLDQSSSPVSNKLLLSTVLSGHGQSGHKTPVKGRCQSPDLLLSTSQNSSSLVQPPVTSQDIFTNRYISEPSSPLLRPGGSQDPLLLRSPESTTSFLRHQSRTPRSPPSTFTEIGPNENSDILPEDNNSSALGLFSPRLAEARAPTRNSSYTTGPRPSSSPTTMPSSPQIPIVQQLSLVADLTLRHPEPPSRDDLEHVIPHGQPEQLGRQIVVLGPDRTNISRYSLRMRQPVQLAPYSHDKINYKLALRNNPDAIVAVRSPERNRHGPLDEYENDGTQNETQDTESRIIRKGDRSRSRSLGDRRDTPRLDPETPPTGFPEILQDLPTTDEEEDEERRTLSREARKILRERKARERKECTIALKNGRSFPLADSVKYKRRSEAYNLNISVVPRLPAQSLVDSDDEIVQDGSSKHAAVTVGSPPKYPFRDKRVLWSGAQLENHDSDQDSALDAADETGVGADYLDDGQRDAPPDHGTSSGSSGSEGVILDRKRLKALNHMMPRFMVNRLINGSSVRPQQKKQGSATVTSDTESDVPLLPGQTRVRKSSRALHAQEIQGDSESSDSGDRLVKRGTSDSDVEIVPVPLSPSFHVQRHGNDREITLNGTESNTERSFDESSDEDIADEAIQAYLDDDDSRNDVRDVNLIDWMLSRTRTIGTGTKSHKHSSTTRNRKSRKGKYTLDIVTRRARKHGKGKQTLLSFDKHTSALGRHDRRSFRPVPTENDNSLSNAFQVMVQATKNYDGKERAKRHPRHKMNGLYIFSGEGNTRIVSGRNKLQPTDANLNFRGSSSSHDWANVFLPPQSTVHGPRQDIQKLKRNNYGRVKVRQDDVIAVDTNEEDPTAADDGVIPQPKKIRINMSIRLLPPGVSFSEETHIRKGKLDQLLRVLSMTARVPEPPPCNMRGYNLHSDMGCNAFLMTLPNICEDILEFSTGLPETDHAGHLREWNIIMRVVCQLLSWFRETSSDEGREHLRQFVEKHAGNTVNRVRELELDSKSLDLATLQLDWFMVELIARAGCEGSFTASNAAATSTFYKALSLLVDHLVELDVHASVDAAKHDKPLNSSTVPQQSAELWVCLIHLLGCYPSAHTPQRGIKPFWSLVMTGLQKREERSNFKASEKVWETIFCLNALSQFSVYGVVTSQPKLPACWPLVTLTMNKIRLTADHVLDQERPAGALIQRDKYISVIILRCFYLCNKWLWQLDDASELFNALGELFRTRKFANLRHEKPDFPLFMLHSDWSLLSECTKTDSAFALFLKLIVKAAKANGTAPELSPKLKKFLSLAIPVGSLPFTKATPPSKEDLSMLFNRFSALAIGIYLDRASYRTRLSHARTYVAFGSADITTRITVIRGMMNLASLIRKIELPRDAMAEWIADISQALADELKSLSMPLEEQNKEQHPPSAVRHHLHICIQILLNSIRRILDLQKQDREYPEHTLISSLKSLCLNSRITNEPKTMHEMQRLTTTLLDARSSALPPSERPHIISDVNTESQEEYNASFDFDFNDPDLIAALGDADGADMANHKINDENLYRAITETNLFWLCWRNLAKFIQELNEKPLTAARLRLLDNHIYCWLGCGDILVHNDSNKSWPMILEQRSHWAIKNEAIQRRVDLGVAMRLLKLHPMIYSTHVNMFLETFLESLAAEDRSIEHEYASLLLSIDGLRHPLLQGLTCVEKSDRGDYNISISDFSTLRLPILRVILDNLNSALERGIGSSAADLALENRTFVGYCIKGFSVMRNVCSTLKEGSQEYKSYVHWCKQVFEFIQGLDYVRSHERLTYWTSWGRSLHIIS